MSRIITRITIFHVHDNCFECPHCLDLSKPQHVDEEGQKFFPLEYSTLVVHPKIFRKGQVIDNPYILRCQVDGTFKEKPTGCNREIFKSTRDETAIRPLQEVKPKSITND